MSSRAEGRTVQGMRMPLLGAELSQGIDYVAERRKAIYPTAEARAELAQLEAMSADLADRLCRRIEALGPLIKADDVFAYFRLRLDAVKLVTFLGHEERILSAVSEGRKRYAPFWQQLRAWPSFDGDRDRKAKTVAARTALLRSLDALASARGAISKAALIANLELCRPLLEVHHGLMRVGTGTVGANDMSRFRAPAYENLFRVVCLASGLPLLAINTARALRGMPTEGVDLRTEAGRHVLQFMLMEVSPERHLHRIRLDLGRGKEREFAAILMLRAPKHRSQGHAIARLFGKQAPALLRASLTALQCQA